MARRKNNIGGSAGRSRAPAYSQQGNRRSDSIDTVSAREAREAREARQFAQAAAWGVPSDKTPVVERNSPRLSKKPRDIPDGSARRGAGFETAAAATDPTPSRDEKRDTPEHGACVERKDSRIKPKGGPGSARPFIPYCKRK